MSGLLEILIIVAIITGIFLLPRMFRRQPETVTRSHDRGLKLNGWLRFAILISFLWLAFLFLYLRPWNNEWPVYFYTGAGPVVLYWGIFWVFLGFKKKGK